MNQRVDPKPVVEPKPAFNYADFDLVDDEAQISYLRAMEEAISARPRAYVKAVKAAGESATTALFLNRIPDVKPVEERAPSKVIDEYLAERHYLGLGFDPGTEHALAEASTYQDILSSLKDPRGRQVTGNTIREKHLAALNIYVGRVTIWSAQQKSAQSEQAS